MTSAQLGKWQSLRYLLGIATNPLVTMRRLHAEHGRFVVLHRPNSRRSRPRMLPCVADAELYKSITSNSEAWRTVNVTLPGLRNTASHRLTRSMTRLQGARHAHYRRLMTPPLSWRAVATMGPSMATIAENQVASWQRGTPTDLCQLAEHLMQDLAIGLLFGNDRDRALPVAEMIGQAAAATWPTFTRAYARALMISPKLEREILAWADQKRGDMNAKDILSIIANNPDEKGNPADREIIGGIVAFTFGAAYETCQNGLAWTLILLTQHPQIATALSDEINGALRGGPPLMDQLEPLPLLDSVIKEGMRLFPPVPIQFRRSLVRTQIGDTPIDAGVRTLVSAFLINRNPDLYPDPYRFRPERWHGLTCSPYDYPVFGSGARMCPGFLFANQMLKVGLGAVLSRHRVDMLPNTRVDHRTRITLTPKHAVPVILRDVAERPTPGRVIGRIHELVDLSSPT
jgi:cytochrome P450